MFVGECARGVASPMTLSSIHGDKALNWLRKGPFSSASRWLKYCRLAVSKRDRIVLARATTMLGVVTSDNSIRYDDALRALREATAETIPAGRTYLIGKTEQGPIIGSLISGVGIVERDGRVEIVCLNPAGTTTRLGRLI